MKRLITAITAAMLAAALLAPTAHALSSEGSSTGTMLIPLPAPRPPQVKIVEKVVEKPVEKIVEVPIFDPAKNLSWDNAPDGKIYAEGEAFQFLERPGKVTPGAKIINTTRGGYCSVGWIVEKDGVRSILTAGHCGAVGDEFALENQDGSLLPIGTMTFTEYRNHGDIGRFDKGLVSVTDQSLIDATLQVTSSGKKLSISAVQDASWIENNKPRMCRLGARTGLSCGPSRGIGVDGQIIYNAISLPGDSGGPVYAVYGTDVFPLGVVSGGLKADAVHQVAQPIAGFLKEHGLTLVAR